MQFGIICFANLRRRLAPANLAFANLAIPRLAFANKMIDKTPTKLRLSAEERRASIVRAATRLFGEKGFRGTTTREIAAAVGVSEPVLYEHFKTKSDLYSAIIDAASQEGAGTIEAAIEKYAVFEDDTRFFEELANMIVAWHSETTDFVRVLLFSNLENHELKDVFIERTSSRFINAVARCIERRIRNGSMRPVNPDVAARAFLGMVSNYALHEIVFRCETLKLERSVVVREMVRIFLGGLCEQEKA